MFWKTLGLGQCALFVSGYLYNYLHIYTGLSLECDNLYLKDFEESLCMKIVCTLTVLFLCSSRHFNTDSLICDCNLKWVLQWARNASVRIAEETVCAYPSALQGLSFRNLKENQLICGELHWCLTSPTGVDLREKCLKKVVVSPKKNINSSGFLTAARNLGIMHRKHK